MRYSIQRGLIGHETRKTNGQVQNINGMTYDICPFCMEPVPLEAVICRGCGAKRVDDANNFIFDNWGWMVLGFLLLLCLCIVVMWPMFN